MYEGIFRMVLAVFLVSCNAGNFSLGSEKKDKVDDVLCTGLPELKEAAYDINTLKVLAGRDKWKPYRNNPILRPGGDGSWDAGALGSMTVVKVKGIYHIYYEAWGRKGKQWDPEDYKSLQIGHAVSLDGIHWKKDHENPVLPKGKRERDWDRNGTWDPFVIYEDGLFKMWYGGGVHPHCNWGFAVSKDGTRFIKQGKIGKLDHVEDDHIVHYKKRDLYYIYYWDRRYEPLGLFRAQSPDEMSFDFANAEKIRIKGEEYPSKYKFTHVFIEDGRWYMYYSNFTRPHCPDSFIRYATSSDGLQWEVQNKSLLPGQDAEVIKAADDLYLMYYSPQGYFDAKDGDIRLAIYNGDLDELANDR